MKKIYNFLFVSYHRPSAKIESLLMFFFSIFLNKKSKTFSERMFLLKFPPRSTIFFNFIGRFFLLIFNLFTLFLTGKFFSKDLLIENKKKTLNISSGNNFAPWPSQAFHTKEIYDDNNNILNDDNFLKKLELDYTLCVEEVLKNKFKDSPWWVACRKEFQNIFFKDFTIIKENLKNFRNNHKTKAALLSDQNFINEQNSNIKNKLLSLDLLNLYHKLSETIDVSILRSASESKVGNNLCPIYRSQRLSHRVLRHAYYTSQINNNIDTLKSKVICDVGGGYGALLRFLHHHDNSGTKILIELPEVCLLANYYLKSCFPKANIATISDLNNIELIRDDIIKKYNFIILPQSFLKNFQKSSIDLFINTTSLSEMTSEVQQYYIDEIERLNGKYFYSVNRAEKRKSKYNSTGFYDLKFKKKWKTIIYKYTHTYHIETLMKLEDLNEI